ncbi:nitrile hydratase subunit alpha (plasmid) [Klebsiella michiganensis]|uniref:nitrile hydratase subunit alpha n=1 Tax=Klebsiella michiganensis TaxID=1134687 RepID=UPI0026588C3A|nr:nitrile hydratase subunit alpha [Klebsiella michiganensis]WKJ95793.1 nitrile hydratase subunit alpha [Klebsiella michiganensis]WKK01068.1 nitrile hydratase subunit alpha [Klebsiella michiganensis]WKK02861.1 nitrile hydratase subunit alpha [Klebsiella michiganensis]WKK07017.1 nitrile hydratase subunit alpha [Klebsiella michiganensis]
MSNNDTLPSESALKVRAIQSLLTEQGLLDPETSDAIVDYFENKIGPRNGAKVVARAWTDSDFKRRLLEDGTAAISEMGYSGAEGAVIHVIENTENVHNIVVCTLCSCYPWPVLGLPPIWFKSAQYRSRVVIDPRGVLKEFGTELSAEKEIRIWDSNAEIRYFVLPQQPADSENLSEEQLSEIVTRDSMIGTAIL